MTVDVKLDELDIQQCPQAFHVPNAFKDTARCHYETTYVSIIASLAFILAQCYVFMSSCLFLSPILLALHTDVILGFHFLA